MLIYNRVLQDGPGNNLYGLEVCKSLHLPDDFLDMANSIRLERFPDHRGISSRKSSKYNSKKIRVNCELCGKASSEVHHIKHQAESDEHGFIGHVHKNHKANLISICHECHERIHKDNIELKKVKTTKGHKIISENKNN
jgi:DNA mismatch repair protein MutS